LGTDLVARNPVWISVFAVAVTVCIFVIPPATTLTVLLVPATAVGVGWILGHREFMPEALVGVAYVGLLGLKLDIAGLHLRPNMLLALVGSVWALRSRARIPHLPWFLAVNAAYLASTVFHPGSPYFRRGIADCFLLTVNLVQYGIVTQSQNLDRLLRILFWASSAAYSALVVLYLFMAAGLLPRLEKPEGDFVRLALLDPTPASYILFTLLALLSYLYLFGYPFSKAFTLWCVAAHLAALAFSFARAAWLAFVVAFACFWLFCIVRFPLRRAVMGTAILALTLVPLAVGAYWYLSGRGGELLLERAQAVSLEEGTVIDRLVLWDNMLEDWRSAPILGHGAHDYGKFQADPTQISENYTLELLHSGGLVTAGFFVVGLGILLFRALPWSWRDAVERPWSLPLAIGFLGMSLSALANPAMEGGVYWVGAGLLAMAARMTVLPRTSVLEVGMPQH
jgi:O-antigen ligase